MKYRTTIHLVTEASNEHEANEIVGEYLDGEIHTGVNRSCVTKPVNTNSFLCSAILVCLIAVSAIFVSFDYSKTHAVSFVPHAKSVSACQPPLKTDDNVDFKNSWREEETKKAVEYIQ